MTISGRYGFAFVGLLALLPVFFGSVSEEAEKIPVEAAQFSPSTDVKELISRLEFKLDPKWHSIVIFGFRWKGKTSGKEYPLTRLIGGTTGDEEYQGRRIYHVYSLGSFRKLGFYKLAQSDILTLYLVFEDTRDGTKPEKTFKFAGFESENFRVQYMARKPGEEMLIVHSFPVKPGAIHYVGNFFLDVEPDSKEGPMKAEERSKETFSWITKNVPTIPGFQFEKQ